MTATLHFAIQNSITGYANNIIYICHCTMNCYFNVSMIFFFVHVTSQCALRTGKKNIAATPNALFSLISKKQYKHIFRNKNAFHWNVNPMCSSNVYVTSKITYLHVYLMLCWHTYYILNNIQLCTIMSHKHFKSTCNIY